MEMEPSIQTEQLWNALVSGGNTSTNAISDFKALPELKRDATVNQILSRAKDFITTLIEKESEGRHVFRPLKDGLLRVLESIPTLATTAESRKAAITQIAEIEQKSLPLTNVDILTTCDEVLKTLNEADAESLTMPQVIECKSLEELKKHLGDEIPAEILEQLKKEDGPVILGVFVKKPKK